MSFTEVVERAKQGNSAAWEELYTLTCKEAYFVAVKVCGKEQDSADLVQDAYVTAYQHLNQLQDPEKFRSWLNMIVANHCRDYLKKKRPTLFSELESDDSPPLDWVDDREYAQPDAQIDHEETIRLVSEIISTLPEDQRLCVMLYYREELSVSEIAQALEVSEGTVKSRLNYARQKVAKKVRELEKQGTKLYGLSPLPFLLFLLRREADAAVLPAALASSAPAAAGSAAAATGAKGAAAIGTKASAALGAKSALTGIGAKIAAGALAAAIAVGGGAAIYRQAQPSVADPPATGTSEASPSPSASVPAAETKDATLAEEAYSAYEELLTLGFAKVGDDAMEINYYAYLDLNSDGIPELLVSDCDGTEESWGTGVLYTYQNAALKALGETNSRYDYFYLVNDKYLLGRHRMGNQFFSCDESMVFALYHWNEDHTCNDPAVWRNNGDYEYITKEKFDYYQYMPTEAAELGVDCFIQSAEPIELLKNDYRPVDILAENLDFTKAWVVREPDPNNESQVAISIFAFNGDKTFYHTYGYEFSEFGEISLCQYEINGDCVTFIWNINEKPLEFRYRIEVRGSQVWLTQLSEDGIFFFGAVGKEFLLEEDLFHEAQFYIDAYQYKNAKETEIR